MNFARLSRRRPRCPGLGRWTPRSSSHFKHQWTFASAFHCNATKARNVMDCHGKRWQVSVFWGFAGLLPIFPMASRAQAKPPEPIQFLVPFGAFSNGRWDIWRTGTQCSTANALLFFKRSTDNHALYRYRQFPSCELESIRPGLSMLLLALYLASPFTATPCGIVNVSQTCYDHSI